MDVVETGLRTLIRRSVRRGLRGVWMRGALPSGAAVIALNHHSWWDGYLVAELAWQRGERVNVLMDEAQLARFVFFRRLGVLGAHELRPAVRCLKAGQPVWIFPEGELRPQGPLGDLRDGAAWLARAGGVPLVPVALRVVMRGQEHPEAYLRVGEPTRDLVGDLARTLAALDADLLASDPEAPLPGYLRIVRGEVSTPERLAGLSATLARLTRRPR